MFAAYKPQHGDLRMLPLPIKRLLVETARGVGRLPGIARLSSPLRGNPVIVGYHRVLPHDQWQEYPCIHADLAVTPALFSEHMAYWAANATPVSMDDVAQGSLPRQAVAVGFDDFYADVALHALPILEKYNIPAVLYLCTDFVEGTPFLWWYGIDAAVNSGEKHLDLHFAGEHFTGPLHTPSQRLSMFRRLNAFCFKQSEEQQRLFIECLGTTRHCYQREALPTWEMVGKLADHPLVTIGAHTLNHGALGTLTEHECQRQMQQSRILIEEKLGKPVRHLAYPFGGHNAAWNREYALAAELGFATAVTTERGTNSSSTSQHALFRSVVLQEHGLSMLDSLNTGWDNALRNARKCISGRAHA